MLFLAALAFAFAAYVASAAPIEAIDSVVTAEMKKTQAPGVIVGVVGPDGKARTRAYGLANVELDVKISDKTIFQTGSIGKQFTSAAVMLLVEEGKIALQDPITKYLKGAPAWWRKVTVRHLLTHTSGMTDYPPTIDLQKNYSEAELEKAFHTIKPMFAPGGRWSYSNPGYALLGVIVRKASGQFYGDMLQARVFKPLGMTTARVISEADIVMNRAAGYRSVEGQLKNQEWVAPQLNTTADGSLYLSALDYIAWDKGLRAKAILRPESWAQALTPVKLNSGKSYPYGFGWFIDEVNGEPLQSHSGSWQGFRTGINRYVGRGLTVIVLANHEAFDSGAMAPKVAGVIDPKVAEAPLKPIADTEPKVTERLKALLAKGAAGKLSARDLKHMPATWVSGEQYAKTLKPLGPLQRLDLLQRREKGDDRVYKYNAVYATQTLRVDFALAPDDGVSLFGLKPLEP